MMFCKIVG